MIKIEAFILVFVHRCTMSISWAPLLPALSFNRTKLLVCVFSISALLHRCQRSVPAIGKHFSSCHSVFCSRSESLTTARKCTRFIKRSLCLVNPSFLSSVKPCVALIVYPTPPSLTWACWFHSRALAMELETSSGRLLGGGRKVGQGQMCELQGVKWEWLLEGKRVVFLPTCDSQAGCYAIGTMTGE